MVLVVVVETSEVGVEEDMARVALEGIEITVTKDLAKVFAVIIKVIMVTIKVTSEPIQIKIDTKLSQIIKIKLLAKLIII